VDDAYQKVVEANEEIVYLACEYQDSYDSTLIIQIHDLLKPITTSEAVKLVRKAGLPMDLVDDMVQEAYIRLRWAVLAYDYSKNPTFVTFWRTTIRNHLQAEYQRQWRHNTLVSDFPEVNGHEDTDRLVLQELSKKYLCEFSTWPDSTLSQLAKDVLLERIIVFPEQQTPQKVLAERYGLSQSQISHWESWIRRKIVLDYQGT
jgi:RNA polymerase sigma factor (sigma-70 family)